ncbi:MAG: glycosyltransferase family 1 protein [Pyrinomonadaceae bacterium]|nr:glycosyltransferase family 1 protein [Pyrinomonadaceae bacterium]
MKLIISQLEALRGYVSREFYYVMTELMASYDWKQIDTYELWRAPGSLTSKLLNNFGELPDAILFWEGYEFVCAHTREIGGLDCKKFILADDLHCQTEEMREMKSVSFDLCDTVLSTYGYVWDRFYQEFQGAKKVVWVPHSASPDFLLPYNSNPENAIFLSGAISWHYPLRQQVKSLYDQGTYAIAYHGHPGYHCRYDYKENEDIGLGYAKRINSYRAGFTDSGLYEYVLAKYFEMPAAGALLFADDTVSGPLRSLGFIENEHYLPVSEDNLEARILYVLDESNHDELDEIRRRGQALVWEKHKTSDRARQIDEACN